MSAAAITQACAGGDPEAEEELEEISATLGEADAGSADGGAGGGLVGGTTGGLLGGSLAGGSVSGGTVAGGAIGGLLGGGTVGGTGGLGGLDAGTGTDGSVDLSDGGIAVPDAGGLIAGGGLLGGIDGGFLGGGGFGPMPFANWKLDDCGPSTTLIDSSPSRANATRSAQVACAQGIAGGAVLFDSKKDTLAAPAQDAFSLTNRVTVTAWINPANIRKGTLVSKELNGTSAFDLVLNNNNLVFRINLNNGKKVKQIVSKAPIQANRWTHVVGQYDGSFVRLFEDGSQVGQIAASGVIADVNGAIQIGNNQANDFLNGRIDEVWLSRDPVSATDIANMACIPGKPTLAVTPLSSGPQEPGASFTYDVVVTNNDIGACQSRSVFPSFFVPQDLANFSTSFAPNNLALNAGQSGHMAFTVSAGSDAEPGSFMIPVNLMTFGGSRFDSMDSSVEFIVKEPTGCFVRTGRELMIRDLSVVEDPLRTVFNPNSEDPRNGVWTFGHLMTQMAASDAEAPEMVEHMFQTWLTNQTVNGFTLPAKRAIQSLVLDNWPRTANGKLDLTRAPLRLLAIVNRLDSRDLAQGHAGEGRFVFGVLDPQGFTTEFTVIFEYRLPAQTTDDVLAWANRWHALGALPFPSEEYNAALQAITSDFSLRGAEPGRPNGSALAQLRTNEIALTQSRWELREFELSATTHRLEPTTVKLTPDTSFINGSSLVADFINQNESAVLSEKHVVPLTFEGQAFLGGSSFNDLIGWTAPGINDNEARHKFSLNTCNGCHSFDETNTAFLQIFPRNQGQVSSLSPFLTGTTTFDIQTGQPRTLNDLARRNADLKQLVCVAAPPAGAAPTLRAAAAATSSSTDASRTAFISKGISRTH